MALTRGRYVWLTSMEQFIERSLVEGWSNMLSRDERVAQAVP